MKLSVIRSLGVVALALAASSTALADVRVNVDLNPGRWDSPPPVVYAPRDYGPSAVYYGHGHWGDHRDRGRHDRQRPEHHDGGDGRH